MACGACPTCLWHPLTPFRHHGTLYTEEKFVAYQFPPDVGKLVQEHMASGQYASQDELLRDAMRALRRHNEEIAAIQAGIDDMEAGRRGNS